MLYILRFSFLLLLLLQVNLNAKEYAVVASFAYEDMPINKIKALFLKKSAYVGSFKIVPLNLSLGDAGRNSFEKNVLGMNFPTLKSYWTKQHYLGHRPPISLKSQKAMKAFIKNVQGAIGYIELKNVDRELNILYIWSDN
jgi:hypothetical protein